MQYTVIETLPGHPEETRHKTFTGTEAEAIEWANRTVFFFRGVVSVYDANGKKVN